MQKTQLASQYLGGSDSTAEFVLSMLGGYMVSNKTDDKGGKTLVATPLQALDDAKLETFVMGSTGDIQLYWCDNDANCLEPKIRKQPSFKGLATLIVKDIRDKALFERINDGQISQADANQLAWLMSGGQVGVNITKILQKSGPEQAYEYLDQFSKQFAADAAKTMLIGLLDYTERGLKSLDMPDAKKILADVREKRSQINTDHNTLMTKWGGYKDVMAQARDYLEMTPTSDTGGLPRGTMTPDAGN
jgi:hypothetical protein